MALDFPTGVPGGTIYEDDCGNEWVYEATANKWTIDPPEFELPDVDPDSIWARDAAGQITPINPGDELNMGIQNSQIDLTDFPEKT
jgi:hypothetical protein